jgi:hypothetical protein
MIVSCKTVAKHASTAIHLVAVASSLVPCLCTAITAHLLQFTMMLFQGGPESAHACSLVLSHC